MEEKVYSPKRVGFLDICYRYFIALVLFVFGAGALAILLTDQSAREFPFLFCIAFALPIISLSMIFPNTVGLKVKKSLSVVFSPIKKFIKKLNLRSKTEGFFEKPVFLALCFFGFAALELWGTFNIDDDRKIITALGFVFFTVMGFVSLFPNMMKVIGITILGLLGLGILIWIVYAIASAIGAIPVAIIIGAIIIASAIKAKG